MSNFDWSRFRNVGLWVSILSLIPLVLNLFGVQVVADKFEPVVNAVLAILVGMGILNNPTTLNKGYLDDPKKDEADK